MINDLYIKRTALSPEISFKANGELIMEGISTPDNVTEFFTPIFDWVKDFEKTNSKSINLEMYFDYLNTSSTRILVEFINLLKDFKKKGIDVSFIWKYEDDDEDMEEFGEELALVTGTEIKRVSVS